MSKKRIHQHLFQDVYEWAGEIRTVDIIKGRTRFCTAGRIESEAERLFGELAAEDYLLSTPENQLCLRLADYYCELNILHPFREGNGRALRLYFEVLAANRDTGLSWEGIDASAWVDANIAGYEGDLRPLTAIFEEAVRI